MALELPLNVNGTVNRNWLPYCWLVVPEYQAVIIELTSTLKVFVPVIEVLAAALNVKMAVFKSRVEELPITSTSKPELDMFRI